MRVGLAQLNLCVGDLNKNAEKIVDAYAEAVASGAELVVFSELAITGYPPEDLLGKPGFVAAASEAVADVARQTTSAVAIVGYPQMAQASTDASGPVRLYNAAAICANGAILGSYAKRLLPNYSVFDEQRYFVAGERAEPTATVGDVTVGISICEDIWGEPQLTDALDAHHWTAARGQLSEPVGPIAESVAAGAQLLVNLSGSPFRRSKQTDREAVLAAQAVAARCPVAYVNAVGGQDELVFDGGSVAISADGELAARLPAFAEAVEVVELETHSHAARASERPTASRQVTSSRRAAARITPLLDPHEEVWGALTLATADYASKNGFTDVVVATSGGVDSALVTAIARDALGASHTHAVAMPSRYSSAHSLDDARELAANLGVELAELPIEPAHVALGATLDAVRPELAAGRQPAQPVEQAGSGTDDLTDQNLQSRIRGVLLMALSNRYGWLVLTTGNKTEMSVGYSTLYGDTAGAYAVIKDCPKLLVYELCRWRNARADGPWIPTSTLNKPPSAELRADQRDDQSLPPYEVLDPLVEAYVTEDLTADELAELGKHFGATPELAREVAAMVDAAEFKRRQSPLGPRISPKSFGKDRRMPITNRYR